MSSIASLQREHTHNGAEDSFSCSAGWIKLHSELSSKYWRDSILNLKRALWLGSRLHTIDFQKTTHPIPSSFVLSQKVPVLHTFKAMLLVDHSQNQFLMLYIPPHSKIRGRLSLCLSVYAPSSLSKRKAEFGWPKFWNSCGTWGVSVWVWFLFLYMVQWWFGMECSMGNWVVFPA